MGYVYFVAYDNAVWRNELPVIKIGSASDIDKRLSQLSTGSPVRLVCAGFIETMIPQRVEKSLHAKFSYAKFKGEWFDVGVWPMLNELKELNIKNSRIEEFFGSWDDVVHMKTNMRLRHEVKLDNALDSLRGELAEKNSLIEKLTNRLIEIDPLASKLLPKKSCRPPGRITWHFR